MSGYGTAGSIADMFRQANYAQRAPAQIERITQAADPVVALLGEGRIYTDASDKLREIVAPRVFHDVSDMLSGRIEKPDFVRALKVLL